MKKGLIIILAVILMLSMSACEKIGELLETDASAPDPAEELLAGEYVEILKGGSYQYSYIVPYDGMEMTTTEAAKDGDSVYKVAMGEAGSRIVRLDGGYYAIDDRSGEMVETTAERNPGGDLDFSDMAPIGSEMQDGMVFEKYSMRRNGQLREFTFVFEDGELIGLDFSYMDDDSPYFAVTEFTGEVDETLFAMPETGPEPLTVENASIRLDFTFSSGTITYTGEVDENGLPHGQGAGFMEADADGDSWTYDGMWEHGHFCGQGELTSYTQNYMQRRRYSAPCWNTYSDAYPKARSARAVEVRRGAMNSHLTVSRPPARR